MTGLAAAFTRAGDLQGGRRVGAKVHALGRNLRGTNEQIEAFTELATVLAQAGDHDEAGAW